MAPEAGSASDGAVGGGSGHAKTMAWLEKRKAEEAEMWSAFWRLRRLESEGTMFTSTRYRLQEWFDQPISWFKEKVVDPLHAKYKPAFFHRRLSRVPEWDQCKVTDNRCMYEAGVQYRLDRAVDMNILDILMQQMQSCLSWHEYMGTDRDLSACVSLIEDVEEAELNFFIKYGEMGQSGNNAGAAYAKQKHRMIWERRNPEIMAERERRFKEHKRQLALGNYDHTFWKSGSGLVFTNKEETNYPFNLYNQEQSHEDSPISKDWQFYRDVNKDGTQAHTFEKERVRADHPVF